MLEPLLAISNREYFLSNQQAAVWIRGLSQARNGFASVLKRLVPSGFDCTTELTPAVRGCFA